MIRVAALLALLLLIPATGAQEDELAALLDRMEARRKGLQDFRATVSTFMPVQLRTGVQDLRRWTTGSFAFRSPGDAAWAIKKDRADYFHGDHLDQTQGIKASIHEDEFLLHAPQVLHQPSDGPGRLYNFPYGATWFRNHLVNDTPPLIPMLATEPQEFPVVLLYVLSPKKYLSQFPSLKLMGKREVNGKPYFYLIARPATLDPTRRKEEASRTWNRLSWIDSDIWIDAQEDRIDRIEFRVENSSSGPVSRWITEYRFSRNDKVGGNEGIPLSIGITSGNEDRPEKMNARIDLSDIKVNSGVKAEELMLLPPADKIVRDWFPQTASIFGKQGEEPATWLHQAMHRMRAFDYEGAETAFRKVIELKPNSEEGYIGLAYVLASGRSKSLDLLQGIEKGIAATKSDELRWIVAPKIADKDPAGARKHLEAILASRGESPKVLEAIAMLIKDPAERRTAIQQTIKADPSMVPTGWLWHQWKQTQPADKDRQTMVKICEDGLRKEDRIEIRHCLLDLYQELGKKDEVKKQAKAMVALLEKKPLEGSRYTIDRMHEVFRAEKDADSIARMEKVFAVRDDDDGEVIRLVLDAEAQVAKGDLEGWVRYFNEKILPVEKNRMDFSWEPGSRFIVALKREKKLAAFLERLFVTPKDDPNYQDHHFAAQRLASKFEGSEQDQVMLRLRALENGPVVSAQELLRVAQLLVMEKKWKEAKTKAEEVVKVSGLKGQPVAEAYRLIAMSHEGLGEFDKAAAACGRALEEKDINYRHALHLFKAKMLVALSKPKEAVVELALGFDDAAKEPTKLRRWSAVRSHLKEMAYTFSDFGARKRLLEAAEAAAPSAGMHALLGALRSGPGAADAFEKARVAWKDDPVLLRAHLKAAATALQLAKAIALRAELIPLLAAEDKNLFDYDLKRIGNVNQEIVNGCIVAKDTATAKSFARLLASEPISNDTNLELANLLGFVKEEAFIEEIDKALVKSATGSPDDGVHFYVHYPAAYAWHQMGKTEKAIALYKDITEEKGWKKGYVDTAKAWIAQWEKEAKKP